MRYYPINLDLKGKKVVVIGAGSVAYRKVLGLIEAGAVVEVVAPESHPELKQLAQKGAIRLKERGYVTGDLRGAFAAIAATDDRALNLELRDEATSENVLLNIVDKPEFCDFVFPAKVARGEFLLTISTGGGSPALAKKIREELEAQFGEEYGDLTALLAGIRAKIPPEERRKYEEKFSLFVRSPILEAIRANDSEKIRSLVRDHFGEEFL
ncbi:MAG: bifunctional precorrin-2 dehydrogenase/sirohydrochlorin ferrochelatase [Deltaproteobacteria bacterium]|nr:bifunctional precorrin-2 dehydrogenase/sirohydrochlorin ferrochelatase [Deltaproteobacteria bacterium]